MKSAMVLVSVLFGSGVAFAQGSFDYVIQPDNSKYVRIGDWSSTADALNVVFIGDGFKEAEMSEFDDAVDVSLFEEVNSDGLVVIEPYASAKCRFRFWKVQLISSVSGIGGGSPLGCSFGGPGQPYMMVAGDSDKCAQAVEQAGLINWDYIVVITNTPDDYGAYFPWDGKVVYLSSKNAWGIYLAHELGHAIASLGDEYECNLCYPGSPDDNRTRPSGMTLDEPNLSTDLGDIKWKALIPQWVFDAGHIPTVPERTCDCEVIGAWEGGGYYKYGVYRSEEYCAMDQVMCSGGDAFCAACYEALSAQIPNCFFRFTNTWGWANNRIWELPPCFVCEPNSLLADEIKRGIEFDAIIMKLLRRGNPPWYPGPRPLITVLNDWGEPIDVQTRIDDNAVTITFEASRIRRYTIVFENNYEVLRDGEMVDVEFYRNGAREEIMAR